MELTSVYSTTREWLYIIAGGQLTSVVAGLRHMIIFKTSAPAVGGRISTSAVGVVLVYHSWTSLWAHQEKISFYLMERRILIVVITTICCTSIINKSICNRKNCAHTDTRICAFRRVLVHHSWTTLSVLNCHHYIGWQELIQLQESQTRILIVNYYIVTHS